MRFFDRTKFPVLAGFKGGMVSLLGPTGGYIGGFCVASYVIAILKKRFSLSSWKADLGLTLMGTCFIFMLGVPWLAYFVGWEKAFFSGVLPFIIPGFVKAGLLCTALQIYRYVRPQ